MWSKMIEHCNVITKFCHNYHKETPIRANSSNLFKKAEKSQRTANNFLTGLFIIFIILLWILSGAARIIDVFGTICRTNSFRSNFHGSRRTTQAREFWRDRGYFFAPFLLLFLPCFCGPWWDGGTICLRAEPGPFTMKFNNKDNTCGCSSFNDA